SDIGIMPNQRVCHGSDRCLRASRSALRRSLGVSIYCTTFWVIYLTISCPFAILIHLLADIIPYPVCPKPRLINPPARSRPIRGLFCPRLASADGLSRDRRRQRALLGRRLIYVSPVKLDQTAGAALADQHRLRVPGHHETAHVVAAVRVADDPHERAVH